MLYPVLHSAFLALSQEPATSSVRRGAPDSVPPKLGETLVCQDRASSLYSASPTATTRFVEMGLLNPLSYKHQIHNFFCSSTG